MAKTKKKKLDKSKKGPKKARMLGPVFGVVMAIVLVVVGFVLVTNKNKSNDVNSENGEEVIYIWYSDEALTDYLNSVALAYYDEKGIKVVPVYHTSREYLEAINAASISGNEVPDLYIAGTDTIEKSAMSGLAIPVSDGRNVLSTLYYPQVALDAVTYKDEAFGYPFYYETAFLLYNKSYLKEMAAYDLKAELAKQLSGDTSEDSLEDEGMADIANDDDIMSPPEGVTPDVWENALEERVPLLVPKSIQDLQYIAATHGSPQNVESFLYWDVTDIFFTYFITGAYMNVGGQYGDDINVIDIYNDDVIVCISKYQALNQYFSIDSRESKYEDVIDNFIDGKYIYTIATSDSIPKLEAAKAEGRFQYEYDIAMLPGVDNEHVGKGLSYTNAIMINGFTCHREAANDFAAYLAYNNADKLYSRTGKLPAASSGSDYGENKLDDIKSVYANSVPLPKIIELSNFWLKLEQAYTLVWDGEEPEMVIMNLEEDIKAQLGR